MARTQNCQESSTLSQLRKTSTILTGCTTWQEDARTRESSYCRVSAKQRFRYDEKRRTPRLISRDLVLLQQRISGADTRALSWSAGSMRCSSDGDPTDWCSGTVANEGEQDGEVRDLRLRAATADTCRSLPRCLEALTTA
ncbi:hypothetical protein MRX96_025718 [Rhipicephalus microplus]